MRQRILEMYETEQEKKKAYVESCHTVVFDARKQKLAQTQARKEYERVNAIAIGQAAKVARAERREQAKATVKREKEAAREYTSRVRYETRPELRQDSAAYFRTMREDKAEAQRQERQMAGQEVAEARRAYIEAANRVRNNVETLHSRSHAAREAAADAKRQAALAVRRAL